MDGWMDGWIEEKSRWFYGKKIESTMLFEVAKNSCI